VGCVRSIGNASNKALTYLSVFDTISASMVYQMKHFILLFILGFFLTSCAGYRFKEQANPLKRFGIKSVSVPMFVNKSILPNVASVITKEIILSMAEYTALKVVPRESLKEDAILLGIVSSDTRQNQVFSTNETKLMSGDLEKSISPRGTFYVPTSTAFKINIQFVLIKNPIKKDLELLRSNLGKHINAYSKILFNEGMSFSKSFTREINSTLTPVSGGVVNFTKNKAIFEKALEDLAEEVATTFKQEVLDAF